MYFTDGRAEWQMTDRKMDSGWADSGGREEEWEVYWSTELCALDTGTRTSKQVFTGKSLPSSPHA